MKLLFLLLFIFLSTPFTAFAVSMGLTGQYQPAHPLVPIDDTNATVHSFSLLPLLSLENGWEWKCQLCVRVPTLSNKGIELYTDKTGIQKLAIHLELKEKIRWGDAKELGLNDIAFTWQVIKNLPPSTRLPNLLQEIEDIIVRSTANRHFTLLLRSVSNPYPVLNAFLVLPEHLEKEILGKDKNWAHYFANSLYIQNPLNPGLYNGPFLPTEESLHKMKFKKNERSLTPSQMEHVDLEFFSKFSELASALESGKVDMTVGLNVWNETLHLLSSLEKSGKPFQIHHSDSNYYEHLDFNLRNPIFQDMRVRKALAYAIDKEFILRKITQNWTIPAVSPVPPGDPYFSQKVEVYNYAPEKARKILSEADWQLGSEGYCIKKNRTLGFEILTVDDPLRIQIANYLVQAWKAIGAQVKVRVLPLNEFQEKLSKRHFSGLALYAWKMTPFLSTRSLFHSTAIPSLSNGYSGQNVSGWINTRVDDAMYKFMNSIHESDREHHMEFFQTEYTRELPGIPLFYRLNVSVFPKEMGSYVLGPLQKEIGLSASQWKLGSKI